MKKGTILILLLWGMMSLCGCHEVTVGYLQTENAVYVPDSMVIRRVLDETKDAYRMYNVAPWVSPKIQGLIGTDPLMFAIERVRASEGADPELFKHLLNIRGSGRMEFPLISDIPRGRYIVSVRVYNEGHSSVIKDAFTFLVQ